MLDLIEILGKIVLSRISRLTIETQTDSLTVQGAHFGSEKSWVQFPTV